MQQTVSKDVEGGMQTLKMFLNEIGLQVLHAFVGFDLKKGKYWKKKAVRRSIVRLGLVHVGTTPEVTCLSKGKIVMDIV